MANNTEKNPVKIRWSNVCREANESLCIQLREYPRVNDLWHVHKGFGELVIVVSGNACNDSGERHENLGTGDIQVLPPDVVHRYSKIHKFRHYTLLFLKDWLSQLPQGFSSLPNFNMLFAMDGKPSPILHISEDIMSEMIGLLEGIRTEYLAHNVGWSEAVFAQFCYILVFIFRHAMIAGSIKGNALFQIGRTIRHMENNLSSAATIQTLCAYAHMSESSFRHHFQAWTGHAPIAFLIRLRLKRAALMLALTEQP
ncbi:MAG: AraC family ligand binding domain-containing protein, partial [Victivallales bacterium]|nr:AraC family ligand binding domain-containing protein [Victivallales bacterium]